MKTFIIASLSLAIILTCFVLSADGCNPGFEPKVNEAGQHLCLETTGTPNCDVAVCKKCQVQGAESCIECKNGYKLTGDGRGNFHCVQNGGCNTGFEPKINEAGQHLCLETTGTPVCAVERCKKCQLHGAESCIECKNGYKREKNGKDQFHCVQNGGTVCNVAHCQKCHENNPASCKQCHPLYKLKKNAAGHFHCI